MFECPKKAQKEESERTLKRESEQNTIKWL